MSKRPIVITHDEWLLAIGEVKDLKADVVPPGWITMEEFAKVIDRKRSTACAIMRGLIASGKAVRKDFRIQDAVRIAPRAHYSIKK